MSESTLPPAYKFEWVIRWVHYCAKNHSLCAVTRTVKSTIHRHSATTPHTMRERGKTIIHRRQIETILATPKDLRSQIILELAGLQGFRTGEVSSFQVGYAHFETGMLTVKDSKKGNLTEMPMRRILAKHLWKYINEENLATGYMIPPLPNAHHTGHRADSRTRGEGLSESQLNRICFFWCDFCNVPRMTLRKFRQYFAYWLHFVKHFDVYDVMLWMRHDNVGSTQAYLEKLRDFDEAVTRFREADESDLVAVEQVEAWQK